MGIHFFLPKYFHHLASRTIHFLISLPLYWLLHSQYPSSPQTYHFRGDLRLSLNFFLFYMHLHFGKSYLQIVICKLTTPKSVWPLKISFLCLFNQLPTPYYHLDIYKTSTNNLAPNLASEICICPLIPHLYPFIPTDLFYVSTSLLLVFRPKNL